MSKLNLAIVGMLVIGASLACKSLMPVKTAETPSGPTVDFTTPGKSVDVKVELDKKHTVSQKMSPAGGTVSLTSTDGSKFTLDVPANALGAETEIIMTAVKSMDGAPLDSNKPTAVQLEPSGQFFKQMLTLTIVPAKEIPVKNQIIFGYEGDGKDYHLAVVDPKSKDIKIKLMGFSGAGVGSGSDEAWAAHLLIEANDARTRLVQKFGDLTQTERIKQLLGDESGTVDFARYLDAFKDQVVMKEIAAAELDCKHAAKAIDDLLYHERLLQLLGGADSATGSPGFKEKTIRLMEIGGKCKGSYRVKSESGGASFTGEICSLSKPFTINVDSVTGKWPMEFTPSDERSGQMTGTFSSNGCTLSGGGPYSLTLTNDGSGTITFTYNSTATCPFGNQTTSKTSTLPLKPAPDLSCP